MKRPFVYIRITSLLLLTLVVSCEKNDPSFEDVLLKKSQSAGILDQQVTLSSQIEYLTSLIESIDQMVEDGILNSGNANALIVKINNALKSYDKGNLSAVEGQLGAFENEVEEYIDEAILPPEYGEVLLDIIEYALDDLKGEPVISDGLIAFYPFNGSISDGSGNYRDGTAVNLTYSSDRTGKINAAASFLETSSVVLPPIGQVQGSFSIALWYKTTYGGTILRTDNIELAADPTYVQFITAWLISIGLYTPASNPCYLDDTWHHVVVTHDVDEERIVTYFDGVVRHSRPNSGYFLGNEDEIFLGAYSGEYMFGYPYVEPYFVGTLDDIYFFDRALTPTEVGQLFYYPQ